MLIRYGFMYAETDTALDVILDSYANCARTDDSANLSGCAKPKQDVFDQEIAGSNVAPSAVPDLETEIAEPVEAAQKACTRMIVEPVAGEKKKAIAMLRALDTGVEAGTITLDDVVFESPWFSVVQHDFQRSWVTVRHETGELDTLSMDGDSIIDSKAGTIRVGKVNVAESLTSAHFLRLGALVNK